MKKFSLFLLILIRLIEFSTAKDVYFYTTSTGLIQRVKVRIYKEGEKILEIKESEWRRMDFGDISNCNLIFKSGTYFTNRIVNINFANKETVFIKIHLEDMSWDVYEQSPKDAPKIVYEDYMNNAIEKRKAIHPTTDWNEVKLKKYLENEKYEPIEGIYENSFKTETSLKYKVGVKKIDNQFCLIYLSGGLEEIWHEGDLKARLEPTATEYFYKANWFMADKSQNKELYISFEKGLMNIVLGDGKKHIYIKLYPISTSFGNEKSTGTGFAISENGFIVTNYHVVANSNKIQVRGVNGDFSKSYSAKIIIEDKINDLAIVKIIDLMNTPIIKIPYKFNTQLSDVGSSVFALGYPLLSSMGDEVKLTNGIISSKTGFQGDITTYQISVPVQPGNSGGPLFDSNGNVIGIISAKHLGTENVSYSIKTNYLYNLVQVMDTPIQLSNVSTLKGKTLPELVKELKSFVYIIEIN